MFNPKALRRYFASPLFREGERVKVRGFSGGDVTTGRTLTLALSLAKGEVKEAQDRSAAGSTWNRQIRKEQFYSSDYGKGEVLGSAGC